MNWRDRVPGFCLTPPRLIPLLVVATISSPEAFADATHPEPKPSPPIAPAFIVAGALSRRSWLMEGSYKLWEDSVIREAVLRARARRAADAQPAQVSA